MVKLTSPPLVSKRKKKIKEAKLIEPRRILRHFTYDSHKFALQGMISRHHNSKYFISKQSCG